LVHATRGKLIRAEPVSALYEQNRIHHVGRFDELEDQMCSFSSDYDRSNNGSPDRLDALVWGLSFLFDKMTGRRRSGAVTVEEGFKLKDVTHLQNPFRGESDTSWMI
jgi:phage terminase large subunit-like protein